MLSEKFLAEMELCKIDPRSESDRKKSRGESLRRDQRAVGRRPLVSWDRFGELFSFLFYGFRFKVPNLNVHVGVHMAF
jgi:hypothetical protein